MWPNLINIYNGSGMFDNSTNPFPFNSDPVFYFGARYLSALFKESTAGVPLSQVTSDGDNIGMGYDLSEHALVIGTVGTTNCPTLSSDTNRKSFIKFDGSNDYLQVLNSRSFFNFLHQVDPIFSICFWIKVNANGTEYTVLSNNSVTTANIGLTVRKNTSNQINVSATYGSSGNTIFNFSTTGTILAADGWKPVVITVNESGTAKGTVYIGDNSPETFNVTASAGTTTQATSIMHIGARPTPGTYMAGGLDEILLYNRVITSDEITSFKALNENRVVNEFSPILQWDIDFNQSTKIYSDAAETTNITNGGTIRSIKNNISTSIDVGRKLTSASSGASPLWRESDLNGKSGAEWGADATQDLLTLSEDLFQEVGGKYTVFIVAMNNRADFGSHILDGEEYLVFTGADYAVGSNPRYVLHTSPIGNGPALGEPLEGTTGSVELLAFRRSGSAWSGWTASGSSTKSEAIKNEKLKLSKMGSQNASIANTWWLSGKVYRLIKYVGFLTDDEVEAKINELNTLYGL